MALQLLPPLFIEQQGCSIFPSTEIVSNDDRLFIVCDNSSLAETIISSINEQLSTRKSLSADILAELADEIVTSRPKDFASSSMALALINRNSCLTMQMGKSRIVRISPSTGDIEYDSSNHILNNISSKAKTQLHSRIFTGDIIFITLTDRVDTQQLLSMSLNVDPDNNGAFMNELTALLSKHRDVSPATYVLRFAGSGNIAAGISNLIKDINWKWIVIFLCFAAIITAVSILSLNYNLLKSDNSAGTQIIPTDSDTIKAPAPAITDIPIIEEDNTGTVNQPDTTIKRQETQRSETHEEKHEATEPTTTKKQPQTAPVVNVEPPEPEPSAPSNTQTSPDTPTPPSANNTETQL